MREEQIFHEVLEQAAEKRAAFLAAACGADVELRQRVEALLQAQANPGSFLQIPAPGIGNSPTIDQPPVEKPGTQIGPYKLLQQIGEGGMGVVYMAEQTHPVQRKVALKLIRPGLDNRQVIARFEAERQALALMDHPHIARVLDAGTTSPSPPLSKGGPGGVAWGSDPASAVVELGDVGNRLKPGLQQPVLQPTGQPYFVMELVHGVAITKYCDEHRLTPHQRLELFVPVCQAIQHAHQKGIIHRDIKPSNVMVTLYDGKPVPKVIDFGVAKAVGQKLTESTLFTEFGSIVGTLEYMSPEQTEQNQFDIDTRSDIYSLGVLLYELLTGTTPLDKKRLRGAAILEMLRIIKEDEPPRPSTRLSTTDELPSIAANRSLEPKKLSGLVRGELDWIVMKALEKDRNHRYETANGFAMDVQRYLADEPVTACPPSVTYRLRKFARRNKGGLAVAAMVLFFLVLLGSGVGWAVRDRSAREAEAARQQGERQAKVAGQVESIIAEVDRLEGEQKWPEALGAARRAEAAVAGGEADAATAERVRQRLKDLELIDRLEQIRMEATGFAERDRDYARAFRDYGVDVEELAVEASIERLKARPAIAIPLAAALDDWFYFQLETSNGDAAGWKRLAAIARGIDPEPLRDRLRSTWGRPVSETQDDLRRLADSIDVRMLHPATLYILARTLRQAELRHASGRILREAQVVYPGDFWLNVSLGDHLLYAKMDHEGAIRFYTAALSARPTALSTYAQLGYFLHKGGKLDEAVIVFRRAIELNPKNSYHLGLGATLCDQGKLDEAIAVYRKGIEARPDDGCTYLCAIGDTLRDQGKPDEAIAAYRKAIDSVGAAESHSMVPAEIYRLKIGDTLRAQGKPDEAADAYRKAVELKPSVPDYQRSLGLALRDQNKPAEANAAFDKAIELFRQAPDPKSTFLYLNTGSVLRDQGKPDEAIAVYRQAIIVRPKDATSFLHEIGQILRDQGKLDEAIDAYRKASELAPTSKRAASACFSLGIALSAQGKPDEAIAAYRKAIELDPEYYAAGAYINLGDILSQQNKPDEATDAFRKAIEVKQPYATVAAYIRLGDVLLQQNKLDEAVAVYRKIIELKSDSPNSHNKLAWILATRPEANLRDPKQAVALARRAVEPKPEVGTFWNTLGAAHYLAGDYKEAVAALEKSMELRQGGDSNDWFFLAMAHWQLGEQDKAREWYDRAVEWMDKNQPKNDELRRFRAEAEELLRPVECGDLSPL